MTGCESKPLALTAKTHTDDHLELAVQDDRDFIPELELQDGATREHQELEAEGRIDLAEATTTPQAL